MTLKELALEASKASPPVTTSSMVLAGYPLSDWVLLLTATYTIIQIYFTLKKHLRRRKYDDTKE